jgi:hypothetical protein
MRMRRLRQPHHFCKITHYETLARDADLIAT